MDDDAVYHDRVGVLSADRRDQDALRREEHTRYAARRADHDGDQFEGVSLRVVIAGGQASGPHLAVHFVGGYRNNGRADRSEGGRIGSCRASDVVTAASGWRNRAGRGAVGEPASSR